MHRDMTTTIWVSSEPKGSNSSRNRMFRGIREEQKSLIAQKAEKKKNEKERNLIRNNVHKKFLST